MNTPSHAPTREARTPRRSALIRAAVALTVALLATVASPTIVAADDRGRSLAEITTTSVSPTTSTAAPSTSVTVTTLQPASELDGAGLEARYRTLSAGLVAAYASATGTDISSLLTASGADVNEALGVDILDRDTDTLEEFEQRLSAAQLFPGAAPAATLSETIAASGVSLDSISVLSNINLANRLAGLDTPTLEMPGLGAARLTSPGMVSAAQLNAQPADSMVFGLFANQSLAQFANSAPDLFAQVAGSGLTDPAQRAAWDRSRSAAADAVNAGLGPSLISPCHAAMMSAMATGNGAAGTQLTPRGADCSPCIAAGVYMSSATNRLLSNDWGNMLIEPDTGMNPTRWKTLPQWQRDAMGGQRIDAQADALRGGAITGSRAQAQCRASAAGTSGFLNQNLPGVLRSLGG